MVQMVFAIGLTRLWVDCEKT